jgi:hypothetical protein
VEVGIESAQDSKLPLLRMVLESRIVFTLLVPVRKECSNNIMGEVMAWFFRIAVLLFCLI